MLFLQNCAAESLEKSYQGSDKEVQIFYREEKHKQKHKGEAHNEVKKKCMVHVYAVVKKNQE